MKIKDLKKLLSDLEDKLGDLDDLEIFIRPIGTTSQPVYDMGIGQNLNNMDKDNKNTELNDTDKKLHISDVIQQSEQICDLFIESGELNHEFICKNYGIAKWMHKSHICV